MKIDKVFRQIILIILAYEALGCLAGGAMLIAAPDGSLMHMPISILNGAFENFLWPGVILAALGFFNWIAWFSLFWRLKRSLLHVLCINVAMLGWFWIEIAIIQQVHWLHAMWGAPVVVATVLALYIYPCTSDRRRKFLLRCGILASTLYAAVNVMMALKWPDYDSVSQTVSELSAIDAPSRYSWTVLTAPYSLLMLAFAVGVLRSAGTSKRLEWTGKLLVLYSILGIFWPFVPMHNRHILATSGGNINDVLHLILGALTELLYLIALVAASAALSRPFQVFSWVAFNMVLIFGALTFRDASKLTEGLPTPLLGVWERINIAVFLVWVVVLSLLLLKHRPGIGLQVADADGK